MLEAAIIIGGVVGGLISTLCWNIRRSRCTEVDVACVSCKRQTMSDREMRHDQLNQHETMTGRTDSYVTQAYTPQPQPQQLTRMKSGSNRLAIDTAI